MHLSVYEQSEIFYFAFVFGLFLGVYYDIFRFFRYIGFTSKPAVIFQDIFFMSTAAVASFWFSQTTVGGHLRAFVIFAELAGILSYRYSIGMLSGFVFAAVRFVLRKISKILDFFGNKIIAFSALIAVRISDIYGKFDLFLSEKTNGSKKIDTN